jgi:hypothetical protein
MESPEKKPGLFAMGGALGCTMYTVPAVITGAITFVSSWVYCIDKYGYLEGGALGLIPSLVIGVIAGALWPLMLIVAIAAAVFVLWFYHK